MKVAGTITIEYKGDVFTLNMDEAKELLALLEGVLRRPSSQLPLTQPWGPPYPISPLNPQPWGAPTPQWPGAIPCTGDLPPGASPVTICESTK